MTAPVSLLPEMTGANLPPANVPGLSDDEQALVVGLATKLSAQSWQMRLRNLYYDGEQRLQNIGIAIPDQLAQIRSVVDWPRIAVDPLVQRCIVDGFRLPDETDGDSELSEIWSANGMDAEASLCFLDSFVCGRGYMIVGSPDDPNDFPIVTVESPLNLADLWDPRTRRTTAAYQSYEVEGTYRAVLYLPDQTISMSRGQYTTDWVIDDRDEHGFGEVPVIRFPNRARSNQREGRSEITPAIMSITDSTCRTLLGMEIAREFYAIPHRYVLGASESDFVDSAGNKKSALSMAMSKFLAFERDEQGDLPTVGQFTAFDPSVFTKIVNAGAQLMSSFTQFPPSMFGETTTANPSSADAIRTAMHGIEARATQAQTERSVYVAKVGKLMWRFNHRGEDLPQQFRSLVTDWVDAATPTPAATSDALSKQAGMGAVPPTSDVVLKKLSYSRVERARLAQDRANDPAQQLLDELGTNITAKDIIGALRLLKATGQPSPSPVPIPAQDATAQELAQIPAAPAAPAK